MLRYFWFSLLFTAVCLAAGAALGWQAEQTLAGAASVFFICLVLGVLEVSLSFDNAIVNASVLKTMDPVWRQRFLTWGILIAVFGMRIVFPLLIVAIAAQLGPVNAVRLALTDPAEYERIITGAHVGISAFGGAFLAMVGLNFFFDADKDVHWIGVIERRLSAVANVEAVAIGVVLLALYGVARLLPDEEALTFLVAGVLGLLAFIAVHALGTILGEADEAVKAAGRTGLGAFLYLELLDASFSFDGVIGAFALSNNLIIIALGLGIGAMFVRSMTIYLVDKGTLAQYRYLEHGAFWAILALAGIMLVSPRFHIPELITGLIGAVLIGLSLWWSIRHKRRHPEVDASELPALDPVASSAAHPTLTR